MSKRKTNKPTNTEPHAAGCGCGPCHNSRTDERLKPQPKLSPNACGVKDGLVGRTCIHPRGHEGLHSTGYRTFRDPKPPAEKPARAKKPAEASAAAKACGNEARDPSTGKPFKAVHAKICEREPGHEGPHRVGPRGELELVIEWEDSRAGTVSYNRKAQRPMTLDDEPEDPEADRAARAAMDEHERDDLNDDVPDEQADDEDEDPRPQWLREQTAQRDAAGRGAPATPPDEDDEDDDPEAYETRTDDDRELARRMREEREAHAAALDLAAAVGDAPSSQPGAPSASKPAPRRMDGKDCGVISRRATACVLDQGHDGDHRDHIDKTWADRKPQPKQPQADMFAHEPAVVETEDKDELIEATGQTITCRGVEYPVHPAARIFPTPAVQYRRLVESMRVHGQKHDIERLDAPGQPVIDGCSRLRVCEELGIEPRFVVISVANPIAHVVAVNLDRRHMNPTQRGAVGAELCTLEHGANQHTRTGKSAGPTQAEAAAMVGVSERTVRDCVRVKNKSPEIFETMKAGKLPVGAALDLAGMPEGDEQREEILEKARSGDGEVKSGKVRALVRQAKKRDLVAQINRGRVEPMPEGPFGLIYGDYPWKYENSDQHEGSRGHMGYPPMTMDEVLAHAREAAKRAGKDCVLALWFTNAFLHEIGRVVSAYGATHRTAWTWDKSTVNDKDKAGVGTWGRGRTEHLVIASIGNPVHTLNEVGTLIRAAIREHSRKPDEFAELLAKHTSGPRLELFAREPREGWIVWGAEAHGSSAIATKRSKIWTESDDRARRAV